MRTLRDIDDILKPGRQYGIEATLNMHIRERDLNFPQSEKEWYSMGDLCAEVLEKVHGLDGSANTLAPAELPFLHYFREAFQSVLDNRPPTIEACREALRDMVDTLLAIKSLDDIVQFSEKRPDRELLTTVRSGYPKYKHFKDGLPSMITLEKETLVDWNSRRRPPKKQLSPWELNTFESVVDKEDRPDIKAFRLFPSGRSITLSHAVLREDPADNRILDVIDYASKKEPGIADFAVAEILRIMKASGRTRLRNNIESTH